MVINREATIRWKGYDPDDLKHNSGKRVWANCDICGKGRWVCRQSYHGLCKSCSHKGKKNTQQKNLKRCQKLTSVNGILPKQF